MNMKAIGLSEDGQTLTQCFVGAGTSKQSVTNEASEILESIGGLLSMRNSRKTVDGKAGRWLTIRKPSGFFFALVGDRYPERIGYKALDELEAVYLSFMESHDLNRLKQECSQLLSKYGQPESFDQLAAANKNVNDLKLDVQRNIDKLVANDENLEELDDKARRMRDTADLFSKKATNLERTLWWRNIRFWLIIGAVAIAIIVLIVLLATLLR